MERKCIFCGESLSERGAFCKACGKQSACRDCQAVLEENSNFCVVCGTSINSLDGTAQNSLTNHKPPANTFEFTESKTGRSAKAVLTDESVANLKDTLSLVVSSYPLGTITRPSPHLPHDDYDQQNLVTGDKGFGNGENVIDISPRSLSPTGNKTQDEIKSLFYLDEGKLVLEVQDLKASGIKDFGIRLAYLRMLYTKEVDNQTFLSRDDLNATIKEVMGTLDPHVVNWISNTNDFSIKDEGGKSMI